jgi:hypothetical protein
MLAQMARLLADSCDWPSAQDQIGALINDEV